MQGPSVLQRTGTRTALPLAVSFPAIPAKPILTGAGGVGAGFVPPLGAGVAACSNSAASVSAT